MWIIVLLTNNKELNYLSAPKVDILNTKSEIIEYLLNGTTLKENSNLGDICHKCDISESDLFIALKTIKVLREYC